MSAEQQSSIGKRNQKGRPAVGPRAGAPLPAATLETDRNQLVSNHVGLVKAMAHRLAQRLPSQVEMNELISVGVVGLIDAAALVPMASVAAGVVDVSGVGRAALIVVAAAGVASAGVVLGLPRLVRIPFVSRFRLAGWMKEKATPPRAGAG